MVIHSDRELLLGLVLTDNVLIEERLYLGRLRQLVRGCRGFRLRAIILENRITDGYALVADVGARIIGGRRNELGNGVLRLVAERATKNFVASSPGSHGMRLLIYFTPPSQDSVS